MKQQIADFSKQLNLEELYLYIFEVWESTEKMLERLSYDELKRKIPKERKGYLESLNYSYYACSYYGQFGKGNCSMHYIRYDVLYQAVLERLQYWAKAVQQDEEKVLNKIQKAGNAERIREKKKKASTLKKAENRQNEIDRLFAKMYEDRACEKITERNFIMLSGKYQKEQIELEQQITNLREELSKMEQDMIGAEKWIELIKEYSVPKELTAPLLNAMIEKILIHEATTNEDNERIQEIEIYYRFIGKVE